MLEGDTLDTDNSKYHQLFQNIGTSLILGISEVHEDIIIDRNQYHSDLITYEIHSSSIEGYDHLSIHALTEDNLEFVRGIFFQYIRFSINQILNNIKYEIIYKLSLIVIRSVS